MGMNFFEADKEVFWDVTEFPIRTTDRSYLDTPKSVLEKRAYTGKLQITAYGEEKPDNMGDGITFELIRDKYARLNRRMLLDIGLWELDTTLLSTPKNVMLSLGVPDDYEDEKVYRLKLPDCDVIWKWQDLLAGKEPMSREAVRALRLKAPSNSLVVCIKATSKSIVE
ncbi:unnamed protein product [Brassica oleracea]|uniref:Uncharacterized protein n=2 Tax=Brassica oleracea TaxID=3712 RepID=A0A0D3AYA7_BRAOL|nr:unnamed protein product [Brassica oleracea]